MSAERSTGLDSLLPSASKRCGNSHTRGTSRHAEKTNKVQSEAHGGGYFPEVLYHFYALIERCRTGEHKMLFQNLSMKKIHVPQGVNQQLWLRTDTLEEHCPGSCLTHCMVQQQVGDGTRLQRDLLQHSLLRLKVFCLPRQSGQLPEPTATHTGMVVSFWGGKKRAN